MRSTYLMGLFVLAVLATALNGVWARTCTTTTTTGPDLQLADGALSVKTGSEVEDYR